MLNKQNLKISLNFTCKSQVCLVNFGESVSIHVGKISGQSFLSCLNFGECLIYAIYELIFFMAE